MHVHRFLGLLASAALVGVASVPALPALAASAAEPPSADLVLTATGPVTAVAGATTTFNLDVRDAGPDAVAGMLHVTDTLPAGTTYSAASAPWACAPLRDDPTVVDCDLDGGLAAGRDAPPLDLEVVVGAGATAGTVTDSATASSGGTDPTPDDATDSVDVEVVQRADLSVTAATGTAEVGQSVDQVLTVHNDGPSVARGAALETVLPTGLRYRSATGDGWQCTGVNDVTCTYDDPLGVDEDAPLTLSADVLATAYPKVTTSATVHGRTTDPTPGNDTATDDVDVPALAGLSVRTRHVGTPTVGAVTRYVVRVTNRGPTAAEGPIVVTDQVPDGLSFVTATAPGWDCSRVGSTVSCERAGALATGATSQLVLDLRVQAAAYPRVSNTVTVTGASADPTSADNTSTDVAAVTPVVRLALDLAVTRLSGLEATYTLTATNHGPSATVGPTSVVDALPAGLRFVSASGPGWSCGTAGSKVTCVHAAPLASGATAAITLVTRAVPRVGAVVNTATVSGTSSSPASDRAAIRVYRSGGLVTATGATTASTGTGTGTGTTSGGLQPGSVYTSADDGTTGGTTGTTGGTGGLPETGGPGRALPLTGLLTLVGGAALLLLDRRRGLYRGQHLT